MTRLTDYIWIGDSADAASSDLNEPKIAVLFNCAHDLQCIRGWVHGVEYVHVGLVDGPGNSLATYTAALLRLCSVVLGKQRVLVYDHDGGSRATALVIMCMHALHRRGWVHWLEWVRSKLDQQVAPHDAHFHAFNAVNWRLVSQTLETSL